MKIPKAAPVKHGLKAQKKYGAWRWAGMILHQEKILPKLIKPILDIGGADGPLGCGSIIVDIKEKDILGDPIHYHSIQDIDFEVNTIFSSHLLEHLWNPAKHVNRCWEQLSLGGYYIVQVPSIYNLGNHPLVNKNHRCLFAKQGHPWEIGQSDIIPLYSLLDLFFTVEFCEYVPNSSLLAIARK